MSKPDFAEQAKKISTDLGEIKEKIEEMFSTYFKRGYNSGGVDVLTDADIVSTGATAAQIAAFITLAEQFSKFLTNQPTLQSDYEDTIDELRTDI